MLVLSAAEVRHALDLDLLMDALTSAFIELSAGRVDAPPRVGVTAGERGVLVAMPSFVEGILATKLVSIFPGNADVGVPTVQAIIALFDPDTGSTLAVMDGAHITAMRTAAASALATRALSREDARVLAVLGAGVQGRAHLAAVPRVRSFSEVRVASRQRGHADALAADFGASVAASFEEAVRGADVVCTCTDAAAPVLDASWLEPGAHITSVGVSRTGPELDPETVRAGLLVVESRVAFDPYPAGAHELAGLDPGAAVELGELLSGRHPGRTSSGQITVYKSVGHAVEDAAAAGLVYRRATEQGLGTHVRLDP
jgi:ornithine cyclodeaminase/alanine dehydrogenase-like protein (mu-crystallin family)